MAILALGISCDPKGGRVGVATGGLPLCDPRCLVIVGVTTEDDGTYTCIAVNDMGSASSSASLRVLGKLLPELI